MSHPQFTARVSPDSEHGAQDASAARPREAPRRRNRTINSCMECRRRKMKCDRGNPCENCRTGGQQCVYVAPATNDAQFRRKLAQMKEAKDALDGSLVETRVDRSLRPANDGQPRKRSRAPAEIGGSEDDSEGDAEADGYMEPTPLAIPDAAYADDARDDVDDLGFLIGRMRLSERIGGFYRPRIADEVLSSLYIRNEPLPEVPPSPEPAPSSSDRNSKPGQSFPAPSMDLIFNPIPSQEPLTSYIPHREIADKLLERYWKAVHPVARIVHRPTFAHRYETLWEFIESGQAVAPPLAAIVCAILFSAVVSMSEEDVLKSCHTSREELKSRLQKGTEVALSRAQLLKATKTETLQASVAYLLPMCVGEISRAHSVLTGMVIRLAECMGLHRDPTEYGFPPSECHGRRLIWYQLCYLDLATSEIQGPRPFIHRDGYTTRLPLDVVSPHSSPSMVSIPWNDLMFSVIVFECYEMRRQTMLLRNRVDRKKIGLTKAISKLEALRIAIDSKYGPLFNVASPSPMQRMAGLVMKMTVSLNYVSIMHRYINSVTYRFPDRLRQILLLKGTEALEAAVELESAEDLQMWAWYSASYQNYHTAFLLMVEVYTYPMRKEASRIWRCLDFIFAEPLADVAPLQAAGPTPTLREIIDHRDKKARYLLTLICMRMLDYQKAKGLKIPTEFDDSKIINTPQKVGDDSDPKMPLNYAHGEPETDSKVSAAIPQHLLPVSSGMVPEMTMPTSAQHGPLVQSMIDGYPVDVGNMPSTWGSASDEFSSWAEYDDVSLEGGAYPGIQPNYVSAVHPPSFAAAAEGGFPVAQALQPPQQFAQVDPQILEIDWTLWDTIFPPQVNDGNLDITDEY